MIDRCIDIEDLPEIPTVPQFTINDLAMLHVYLIRKMFQDNDFIEVQCNDRDLLKYVFAERIKLYERFGIIFSNANISFIPDSESLLIIPEEVLASSAEFEEFLQTKNNSDHLGTYSYYVVEKEYSQCSSDEILMDYQLLSSYLPDARCMNFAIAEQRQNSQHGMFGTITGTNRLDSFEYVDIAPLFEKHCMTGINTEKNYYELSMLCKEIEDLYAGKDNTILTFSSSDNRSSYIFSYIAAYLTVKRQMHFEISKFMTSIFLEKMQELTSREYNYLHDYLSFINNPIKIGAYFTGSKGFLVVRDDSRLYINGSRNKRDYPISMSVTHVPLNEETKDLASADLSDSIFDIDRIEIIPINEYFGLNASDTSLAVEALKKINSVTTSFEKLLAGANKLDTDTEVLNMTNILLFRFRGQIRLGYVAYLNGKIPFTVFPICKGYTKFSRDFTFSEYNRVFDIQIFDEAEQLLARLSKTMGLECENVHYQLPSTARGLIIGSLPAKAAKISDDSGFTLEDFGVWSVQTSQCRVGTEKLLLQSISNKALREKALLTFYGGPHPMSTVNVVLEASSWK